MWPVMPTPLLPLLQLGLLLGGCRGGELAPPPPGSEQEIVEVDVAIRRLSVRPAVFVIEGLVDDQMCDNILEAGLNTHGGLTAQELPRGLSTGRSSRFFSRDEMAENGDLSALNRRLANMVEKVVADQNDDQPAARDFLKVYAANKDYRETFQLTHYEPGGYSKLLNEGYERDRVFGFMAFLNEPPAGGEEVFPLMGMSEEHKQYMPSRYFQPSTDGGVEGCVTPDQGCLAAAADPTDGKDLGFCCCEELMRLAPKKGDVILWFPAGLDGRPDNQAVHASCPTYSPAGGSAGDEGKYVLTSWIHHQPLGADNPRAAVPDAGEPSPADQATEDGMPPVQAVGGSGKPPPFDGEGPPPPGHVRNPRYKEPKTRAEKKKSKKAKDKAGGSKNKYRAKGEEL